MNFLQGLGLDGTVPQWGTFLTVLAAFITCVTVWIRGIPERLRVKLENRKLSMDENAQLRQDRRDDYTSLKADLEALKSSDASKEIRIAAAEAHCAAVNLRIGQLEFVFRMVMDELDQISPGNPVAKRAQEMIAALYPIIPPGPDMPAKVDALSRVYKAKP